jgi:hypothetical protein
MLPFLFLGPDATTGLKLCAGDSPSINVTLMCFLLELGILVMFLFFLENLAIHRLTVHLLLVVLRETIDFLYQKIKSGASI